MYSEKEFQQNQKIIKALKTTEETSFKVHINVCTKFAWLTYIYSR